MNFFRNNFEGGLNGHENNEFSDKKNEKMNNGYNKIDAVAKKLENFYSNKERIDSN